MVRSYLTLYHSNRNITSIEEFMAYNKIYTSAISVEDFFEYNRELIYSQMSPSEKTYYATNYANVIGLRASDLQSDVPLPCPCVLRIEAKYVQRELAISQTNWQVNEYNTYAFAARAINRIFNSPSYVIDKAYREAPNCSVFGWFKSQYYVGRLDESAVQGNTIYGDTGKFLDISKYIINLATNVTESGGNFTMTLPIINSVEELAKVDYYTVDGNTKDVNKYSYTDRIAQKLDLYEWGNQFYHKAGLDAMEHNYFNWLIQSNDLIFIAFETLQIEKEDGYRIFDMIGLVDNVTVNQNANGQGSVTVTGRDLMKLLTDDSSLFFNRSSAWGPSEIFANTESMGKQGDIATAVSEYGSDDEHTPLNRMRRISGGFDVFADPFNRTINFIMKGVISQLANIEVVPSTVFESWGDRRTTFAELYPAAEGGSSDTTTTGAVSGNGTETSTTDTTSDDPTNEAFKVEEADTDSDNYIDNGSTNSDTPVIEHATSEKTLYINNELGIAINR